MSAYDRQKAQQRARYRSSNSYRKKKQQYSQDRYHKNPEYAETHKARMRKYMHDRFQTDELFAAAHKEFMRNYMHDRFQTDELFAAAHKEFMRNYMHDRFQTDELFGAAHKEFMRNYMHDRFQTDELFAAAHKEFMRNYMHDRLQTDELFAAAHKEFMRNYMHDRFQTDEAFAAAHKDFMREYMFRRFKTDAEFADYHREYMRNLYQSDPDFAEFYKEFMREYMHERATDTSYRERINRNRKANYQHNESVRAKQRAASQRSHDKAKEKQSDLDKVIRDFKEKAKKGPSSICCSCYRLFFEEQVKECDPSKYTKNRNVIDECIRTDLRHLCTDDCDANCPKGKLWVCSTCKRYLQQGQMPPLSVANGLATEPQPYELATLNKLEQQLIALRLPFMTLANLPSGKQKGVHGPVVMVPANVSRTATALPRMLGESQLVTVKLKRKLTFTGYVEFDTINRNKVNDALAYLKQHSPLYKDISLNEGWHETDEDGLQQLQTENIDVPDDSANTNGSHKNVDGAVTTNSEAQYEATEPDYSRNTAQAEQHYRANQIVQPNGTPSDEPMHDTNGRETEVSQQDEGQGIVNDSCVQPLDMHTMALAEMQDAIISVAPAEGNRPVSIFLADNAEAQTYPALFPTGKNTFDAERTKKLSRCKYFNARLLSADTRFAQNTQYIFHAQFATELEKLQSGISIQLRKGSQQSAEGSAITAGMLHDKEQLRNLLKADRAFTFMGAMRGSPEYSKSTMADLFAMVRTLGIPTWLFSFSSAEQSYWPEVIETIANLNGEKVNFANLPYEKRCEWLRLNPCIAVRMFDQKVKLLMKDLLKSSANPVGKINDYFYRVEFQK